MTMALVAGAALAGCGDDGGGDGTPAVDSGTNLQVLDCEVAIVGGGAGGLHTAFRLAPTLGEKVCLFEKEATLGGRIHDIPQDETDPGSPVMGTGARRVMEGQTVLFDLATELGLTLEAPAVEADLINARGEFAFSKDELLPAYPNVTPAVDKETKLYDALRTGPERASATEYADFRAYIRQTVGEEEYEFLRDMSRFRADFEYPLDARGYLDYLDEEWDVCCTASYPVGGMSTFIDGMEAEAVTSGARIFKSEPVLTIDKVGARYQLTTGTHLVNADKVVIAVPPDAFQYLGGDVIERIAARPEFQAIIGVRVVTITQWWPTAWWADVTNPALTENNHVWRAWTTDQCLNFIEIPLEPYAVAQKVTRTVYDDDIRCVQFWEELAKQGTDAVEAEIKIELEYLFNNGVSAPANVVIPDPVKTHVQVWPAAWHWVRAGAPFTNAEIFAWAVEPLAGEPVGLVGEAYNPQRSGWSDGAYKSSINLLNEKYGLGLKPAPRTMKSPRRTASEAGR